MVEPIHTPPTPPPDTNPLPLKPALSEALGSRSAVTAVNPARTSDVTPAPTTIISLTSSEALIHDRIAPGGTSPAQPGLPGHPMNDSALQNPPTIPATDKADLSPQPAAAPVLHPKLVVLRGLRIGLEYPIYEGRNTIGRFADKPVDIDMMNQESDEQIWCSRQHAVVLFDGSVVAIEDCNSLNGTWLNGQRVGAGQRRAMKSGDVLQVGTVQMKLVIE
jgi:hypothetical protein